MPSYTNFWYKPYYKIYHPSLYVDPAVHSTHIILVHNTILGKSDLNHIGTFTSLYVTDTIILHYAQHLKRLAVFPMLDSISNLLSSSFLYTPLSDLLYTWSLSDAKSLLLVLHVNVDQVLQFVIIKENFAEQHTDCPWKSASTNLDYWQYHSGKWY